MTKLKPLVLAVRIAMAEHQFLLRKEKQNEALKK